MSARRGIGFVIEPLLRERAQLALALALAVLTPATAIALTGTSAYLIAAASLQPSIAELQVAIVGVRLFGVSRGVSRYLERLVGHDLTFRVLASLRVRIFAALEPLAPARLVGRRGGDLLARLVADIEALEGLFVRALAPAFAAAIVAAATAAAVGLIDARLGLVALAGAATGGIALPLLARLAERGAGAGANAVRAEYSAALVDALAGWDEIIATGRAGERLAALEDLGDRAAAARARLARREAGADALALAVEGLTVVAMLGVAAWLVRGDAISGIAMAVATLVAQAMFESLRPLPAAARALGRQLDAARRVAEIADERPAVGDAPGAVSLGADSSIEAAGVGDAAADSAAPALLFDDVTFAYPGADRPVLRGVTLAIAPGARLAIAGPSGAGKSTLAQLAVRFFDPDRGAVRVAGNDARAVTQASLRAHVALVTQRVDLFTGTFAENLRLARADAPAADMETACRSAGLDALLARLPQGLDTPVGALGLELSAGERQRLALARALLRGAPVLVLDEPTAHLDALSQAAVLDTIERATLGRTVVLITHALAPVVARGWEIALIDEGTLVARGTHDELLAASARYRRAWQIEQGLAA